MFLIISGLTKLIKHKRCHQIETSQLICSTNQLTGFYMIVILTLNEWRLSLVTLAKFAVSCGFDNSYWRIFRSCFVFMAHGAILQQWIPLLKIRARKEKIKIVMTVKWFRQWTLNDCISDYWKLCQPLLLVIFEGLCQWLSKNCANHHYVKQSFQWIVNSKQVPVTLLKTPQFHLLSWCQKAAQRQRFFA